MDTSEIYYEMCSKAFPKDAKNGVAFKTQDQLQEMIHDLKYSKRQFSGSHGLLRDFGYWVEEESNLPCASMEQLWLAFVMKEKYQKVWTGNDWTKE